MVKRARHADTVPCMSADGPPRSRWELMTAHRPIASGSGAAIAGVDGRGACVAVAAPRASGAEAAAAVAMAAERGAPTGCDCSHTCDSIDASN